MKKKFGLDEAFNYKEEEDLDAALKRYATLLIPGQLSLRFGEKLPHGIYNNISGIFLKELIYTLKMLAEKCWTLFYQT